MATLTYNPGIFRVADVDAAKAIILTPEAGQSTEERWTRETPYLTDLLGPLIQAAPGKLFVDLGCGIGRMSKALIERYGCQVLGVDISQEMRGFAPAYVAQPGFSVVSSEMFASLVARGLRVDGAISVWVLQHCLSAAGEIARLREAIRPGGRLAVVNTNGRVVPTVEKTWASDGQDVRKLLGEAFQVVEEGQLDAAHVGEPIRNGTFWGAYARP